MKAKVFLGAFSTTFFIAMASCSNDDSFRKEDLTDFEHQIAGEIELTIEQDSIVGDPSIPPPPR